MRVSARLVLPVLIIAAAVSKGVGPLVAGDKAETPAEAMALARPLLDEAIKAEPQANKTTKGFRVNAALVRDAHEHLKGQSKKGLEIKEFREMWNEMISLGHFHNVSPLPDYEITSVEPRSIPLHVELPVGRGWTLIEPGDSQLKAEIVKTIQPGRVLRKIRVWMYQWNVTYSGIGGENAKNLAEASLKNDQAALAKVVRRSDRVATIRMGKGFPKTNYYEVIGEDKELGPVRIRNYYVKGKTTTYNFEVIEYRKTTEEDSPWIRWQCEGDDPELGWILETASDLGK